jgi:hypothetical protein
MRRPAVALFGIGAGFVLAILLLAIARVARPTALDASEAVKAIVAALSNPLEKEVQAQTERLYVRSDFDFMLVPELQQRYPSIEFHEWKDRPMDDGCESSDQNVIVLAPCQRSAFITATVTDSPLWRTLLVRTGQFNGGCDMAAVKVLSRWRIISKRCYVI